MALINVQQVSRVYRVPRPINGVMGLIRRNFDEYVAVSNLNFSIDRGEIVAYLGPNGAGKSTTMKLLSGIIPPSTGTIQVNTLDPYKQRKANACQIGIVFGQRSQLWWDTPVISSFHLLRRMYSVPLQNYKNTLDMLVSKLDLQHLLEKPVRQLSLGQRVRCEIAAVLLHQPQILYLDEPMIGLDIEAKAQVRKLLQYVNEEFGTTIMFTSHDVSEIERLCSRVLLINRGTKIFDGSIQELRDRYTAFRRVGVRVAQVLEPLSFNEPGVWLQSVINDWIWFRFNPNIISPKVLIDKLLSAFSVIDLAMHDEDLEQTLRHAYMSDIPDDKEPTRD